MLSLLSLIIASGSVLRADTELWEPMSYPDPRTNWTQCNSMEGSTLCDPDHLLTDTWRQAIQENTIKQMQRLANASIPYTDDASEECQNSTEGVQIFVILAKRIHTASNQSITSNDLTTFGHGIREAYGLDEMACKNYILILGVELAKEIYVWTGSDLAISKDQIDSSLGQFKNLFTERNYMEGLNKIVNEVGDVLLDPTKGLTTEAPEESTSASSEEPTTVTPVQQIVTNSVPAWMYVIIVLCVLIASAAILVLFYFFVRRNRIVPIQHMPPPDSKMPVDIRDREHLGSPQSLFTSPRPPSERTESQQSEEITIREPEYKKKRSLSEMSLPRSESIVNNFNENGDFLPTNTKVIRRRTLSTNSDSSYETPDAQENQKVSILPSELSTDQVLARRNSDTTKMVNVKYSDHAASF